MKNKKKVMIVFGTRPEAIKMAPVVKQFESDKENFDTVVCVTAQHREMLDQVLNYFKINPQHDLDLMTRNQTLGELTVKVLTRIINVIEIEKPDVIIVQGDTTTTFTTSLAAYYQNIPIGHIEAGLRTNSKYSPFPEEINRRLSSVMSDLHFSPTKETKENLLSEGIDEKSIFVTGNTVIDALMSVIGELQKTSSVKKWYSFFSTEFNISFSNQLKTILVTGHRRESFGNGFKNICNALSLIAKKHNNIQIVYPVHLNPNVQKAVHLVLGDIENIHLISPLDYEPFVFLMNQSYFILSDSGGIQEEAQALGKPVLVMRDTTERPEGIKEGTSKLVGTSIEKIVQETGVLINCTKAYRDMAKAVNLYGNGKASQQIHNIVKKYLKN